MRVSALLTITVLLSCSAGRSSCLLELSSVDGALTAYASSGSNGIPINEFFDLYICVTDDQGKAIVPGDVQIRVDAVMPAHRHGMLHEPIISAVGARWHVQDMLLHMPGHWVLSVDVEHPDGARSRMQRDLVLN